MDKYYKMHHILIPARCVFAVACYMKCIGDRSDESFSISSIDSHEQGIGGQIGFVSRGNVKDLDISDFGRTEKHKDKWGANIHTHRSLDIHVAWDAILNTRCSDSTSSCSRSPSFRCGDVRYLSYRRKYRSMWTVGRPLGQNPSLSFFSIYPHPGYFSW